MTVATEQEWHEDESKKKKISALSAFDGCSWGRWVCVCLPFYYFACVVQILFVVHISESGPNLSLIFLSSNGSRRQHCGDDDAYPPIAVFCIFRVVIYFDWCVFSWQSPMSLAPTRFFFVARPSSSFCCLHFARLQIEQLAIFIYLSRCRVLCRLFEAHFFTSPLGMESSQKRANTLSIEYICYILFTYFFPLVHFRLMLLYSATRYCFCSGQTQTSSSCQSQLWAILLGFFLMLNFLNEALYLHKLRRMNNKRYLLLPPQSTFQG